MSRTHKVFTVMVLLAAFVAGPAALAQENTRFSGGENPTTTEGDPDQPVITGQVPNSNASGSAPGNAAPGERVMQPEFGAGAGDNASAEVEAGADKNDGRAAPAAQYNQTDLEFLSERASTIAVSAVEVRGWDPEKKSQFLGTVKTAAELRSDEDLENFARGVLLEDENLEELEIDSEGIGAAYRMPAKLFGILNASFQMHAEISPEGRVKVRFPWYAFLYKKYTDAEEIATSLEGAFAAGTSDGAEPTESAARIGQALQTVQAALQASYDNAHRLMRGRQSK